MPGSVFTVLVIFSSKTSLEPLLVPSSDVQEKMRIPREAVPSDRGIFLVGGARQEPRGVGGD